MAEPSEFARDLVVMDLLVEGLSEANPFALEQAPIVLSLIAVWITPKVPDCRFERIWPSSKAN